MGDSQPMQSFHNPHVKRGNAVLGSHSRESEATASPPHRNGSHATSCCGTRSWVWWASRHTRMSCIGPWSWGKNAENSSYCEGTSSWVSATKVAFVAHCTPGSLQLVLAPLASCLLSPEVRGTWGFPRQEVARRHGGQFPDAYISNVLRNGVRLPAHGPAEMPVWATDYEATDQLDEARIKLRVKSLTSYMKSMQGSDRDSPAKKPQATVQN
jgi:hypothetical protein